MILIFAAPMSTSAIKCLIQLLIGFACDLLATRLATHPSTKPSKGSLWTRSER